MKKKTYKNVASILIFIFFSSCPSLFAGSEIPSKIEANQKETIIIDHCSQYWPLIKALKNNEVLVPKPLRQSVLDYLENYSSKLIAHSPSMDGLSWHFPNLFFLRNNLVLARYEDGEMYGGELLIVINFQNNKVVSAEVVWDSSSN